MRQEKENLRGEMSICYNNPEVQGYTLLRQSVDLARYQLGWGKVHSNLIRDRYPAIFLNELNPLQCKRRISLFEFPRHILHKKRLLAF